MRRSPTCPAARGQDSHRSQPALPSRPRGPVARNRPVVRGRPTDEAHVRRRRPAGRPRGAVQARPEGRGAGRGPRRPRRRRRDAGPAAPDPEAALRARYPDPGDRALVERTLKTYRQTALAVERTDGLRGLKLLDKLDLEADLPLREAPRRLPPAPRHPDRRRRGRAPAPLAGVFRPEAGRRRRPGPPDRRDRPALGLAAPGGRGAPRGAAAAAGRPAGRDRAGRPLVGRPGRPQRPARPAQLHQPGEGLGRPPRGARGRSTTTARSPCRRSGSRGSTGSRWSACTARCSTPSAAPCRWTRR